MQEKNVIVVYGGSFNPPLNSHFSIAMQVLNQFDYVEKVIFVPTNKNYEKAGLEENSHRYKMLEAVINKNEDFLLSDIDMHDNRSLSTIEVLDFFKNQYPEKEIYFLMGSDNLKEVYWWNNIDDILTKYKIIVLARDNDNVDDIINNEKVLSDHKKKIIILNEDLRSNYSSTYVRNLLKQNKDVRYLMPDEVYYYIKENNLYKE